jgi:hypothetical protein
MTTPIISLTDLINSNEYLLNIESVNKSVFTSLNYMTLKNNLLLWAGQGYSNTYIVYTFPVNGLVEDGLYKCSDGNPRDLQKYIDFFLEIPLIQLIKSYQDNLQGISISISFDTASVNLLASKISQ